jgi:hypothetical protein
MPASKPYSRPRSRQSVISETHHHRHPDRALGWARDRHRVVEEHHDPIARELVARPLELADQWPQRAVILTQEVPDLLGPALSANAAYPRRSQNTTTISLAVALEDFLVAPARR